MSNDAYSSAPDLVDLDAIAHQASSENIQYASDVQYADYKQAAALSNRITYVNNVAPWLANDPETVSALAQQPVSTDQLGYLAGSISAQYRLSGTLDDLQRMDPGRARSIFDQMTPQQQDALRQMGYIPPGAGPGGVGGFLGHIPGAGLAIQGVALGMGGVNAAITKTPVVSNVFDIMNKMSNGMATLFRTMATDERANLAMAAGALTTAGVALSPFTSGVSLGVAALGSAAAGLLAGNAVAAATNPSDYIDSLKDNWNGEAVFSESSQTEARQLLRNSGLDVMARDIGWEQDPYDTVKLFASTPDASKEAAMQGSIERVMDRIMAKGDPRRQELAAKLIDLVQIPQFRDAVELLQRGKFSFGRTMAGNVMHLDPASTEYTLISGGMDALFTIVTDPTLAAGAAFQWQHAARLGVPMIAGEDTIESIRAIAAKADEIPSIGRAYDELALAVNNDDPWRLTRKLRDAKGLYYDLWQHKQLLRDQGVTAEFTRKDIFKWLEEDTNYQSMLSGHGVKQGYGRLILPTYGWSIPMTDKVLSAGKVTEGIRATFEILDDVGQRSHLNAVSKRLKEANPAAAIPKMGVVEDLRYSTKYSHAVDTEWNTVRAFVDFVDRKLPLARKVEGVIGSITNSLQTMMPGSNTISMVGPQAFEDIERMVGLGRTMGMQTLERQRWFNTIMQQDNIELRNNAAVAFLDTLLNAGGVRSDERGAKLADDFIEMIRHRYSTGPAGKALFGDVYMSRGIHPYQHAFEMPIPSLKEFREYAQKGALGKYVYRAMDSKYPDVAINRIWKPLVLLRVGFILRAGGEELLAHLARAGPSSLLAEFGARSIAEGRLYRAGQEAARELEHLSPEQVKAIEKMRYVAHVRPLEHMFASHDWSRPAVSVINKYSEWVRDTLEHGIFPGIDQMVPEGRRLQLLGKQGGFRNALLAGADPNLIRYAESFGGVHGTAIMKEISSHNANFWNKPGEFAGPNDMTLRWVDKEGEEQMLGFIREKGHFKVYRKGDLHYDRMAASQFNRLLADEVNGPVWTNTMSRWAPGSIADADADELLGMWRSIEAPRIRHLVEELLTNNDGRTSTWDATLRRLSIGSPDWADYIGGAHQVVGESAKDADDVIATLRRLVDKRYTSKRTGELTEYGEKLMADIATAEHVVGRMHAMPDADRAWMGSFLEVWGDVPDIPVLIRNESDFFTAMAQGIKDRHADPTLAYLTNNYGYMNRMQDGTPVANVAREGRTRLWLAQMNPDAYGTMIRQLRMEGAENFVNQMMTYWVQAQPHMTGMQLDRMEPIVRRFVERLAGEHPNRLIQYSQDVIAAGKHGSMIPIADMGFDSPDVAEHLSQFMNGILSRPNTATGKATMAERMAGSKGHVAVVDLDGRLQHYTPMDIDGTRRPIAHQAHQDTIGEIVPEQTVQVQVEVPAKYGPSPVKTMEQIVGEPLQRHWAVERPIPGETMGAHRLQITLNDGSPVASIVWDATTGEVGMIQVLPEYQRKGVATSMYKEVTDYAKSKGLVAPMHSKTQTVAGKRWAAEADVKIAGKRWTIDEIPEHGLPASIDIEHGVTPAGYSDFHNPQEQLTDDLMDVLDPRQVEFHFVAGGRDYADRDAMTTHLLRVQQEAAKRGHRVIVVHGGARGADSLAGDVAKELGMTELRFPADWDKLGKSAGFKRNERMADFLKKMDSGKRTPSLADPYSSRVNKPFRVTATTFPGGKGTGHMEDQLAKVGIKVTSPATKALPTTETMIVDDVMPAVHGVIKSEPKVNERVLHTWAMNRDEIAPRSISFADKPIITMPDGSRQVGVNPDAALEQAIRRQYADGMGMVSADTTQIRRVKGVAYSDPHAYKQIPIGAQLDMRDEAYDAMGNVLEYDDPEAFTMLDPVSGGRVHENWTFVGPQLRDAHAHHMGYSKTLPDTRDLVNLPAKVRANRAITAPGEMRQFRSHYSHVTELKNPPPIAVGPTMVPKDSPTKWEQFQNWAFDEKIGGALDAIIRRPLGFHYYAEAMAENEKALRWGLSAHLFGSDDTGQTGALHDYFIKLFDDPNATIDIAATADAIRTSSRVMMPNNYRALDGLTDQETVNVFLGQYADDVIMKGSLEQQMNKASRSVDGIRRDAVKDAWDQPGANRTVDNLFQQTRGPQPVRIWKLPDGRWTARTATGKGVAYLEVPKAEVSSILGDLNGGISQKWHDVHAKYGMAKPYKKGDQLAALVPSGPSYDRVRDAAMQWAENGVTPSLFANVHPVYGQRLRVDYADITTPLLTEMYGTHTLAEWDDAIAAARHVHDQPRWAVPMYNNVRPAEGILDAYTDQLGDILEKSWPDAQRELESLPQPIRDMLDKNSWSVLSASYKAKARMGQTVQDLSAERAIRNAMPYLDSHEIRSQAGEYIRGIFPFMYAEQNFLKRWAKTLKFAPDALRKGQLLYMGLKHGGIVRTDSNGKDWFVYPGAGLIADAMNEVGQRLGLGEVLPAGVVFQTQTSQMLPGFDVSRTGMPSAQPLVAFPLGGLTHIFPELRPIQEAVVGQQGVSQGGIQQFIPSTLRRLWQVAGNENSSVQYASAMMSAAVILQANGHGIPPDATKQQMDTFIRRLRDHTRMILAAQTIVGFISPGSASVAFTGKSQLSHENLTGMTGQLPTDMFRRDYLTMVQELGIEEGTIQYFENHPDMNVEDLLAYTVGQSYSTSGAPLPATATAVKFADDNRGWISQYPNAAAWLLPQPEGAELDKDFDTYAYTQQAISGMRKRRTPTEFMEQLMFKEGGIDYFKSKDKMDVLLADAKDDPARRRNINLAWDEYSAQHKALHPIFADQLEGGASIDRRRKVLDEMRIALNDPSTPDVHHKALIDDMLRTFDRYKVDLAELSDSSKADDQRRVDVLKRDYEDLMTMYVYQHPEIEPFWLTILRPEANL